MNSTFQCQLGAVVWIVVPEKSLDSVDGCKSWLKEHVVEWVDTIKRGADGSLQIRFVGCLIDSAVPDEKRQRRIGTAVREQFPSSKITFEHTSCLRSADSQETTGITCDLASTDRCYKAYRLLLIDEQGNPHPCYGYWSANRRDASKSPLLDREVLKVAYSAEGNDRFRCLCTECAYAAGESASQVFPCSRRGCSAETSMWPGDTFPHLQFGAGERERRCEEFHPVFETSLEQSRLRLEKILFNGDFWRSALIDKNYELDKYWPMPDDDTGAVIPIYGSYRFELDSASSLDQFPASNYFSQEPITLSPDAFQAIQNAFLPVCFLPHLRVMFELAKADEVCLLSVILSDRHRGSEFRYRSLYTNDAQAPECFRDGTWQNLWRLPYDWPAWKENVLNLSSAVRVGETQQPTEYLAVLSDQCFRPHDLKKTFADLSVVCREFDRPIEKRAEQFRQAIVGKGAMELEDGHASLLSLLFTRHKRSDDEIGHTTWNLVARLPWSKHLHVDDAAGAWINWLDVSEDDRGDCGCRLLNYLVWTRSVFGRDVGAVEAFNSTSVSDKPPSQFVVFSVRPLCKLSRSRFKLTLTTLLQPIESAYAIGTEIDKQQVKGARDLAAGVYKVGHPLKDRVGPVRSALGTIAEDLKAHVDHKQILEMIPLANERLDRVESLGHVLDALSRAISSGQGSAIFRAEGKDQWRSDHNYLLDPSLRAVVHSINESEDSERYSIDVSEAGWKSLEGSEITRWITGGGPPVRPADLFYREVLTEIVVNAAKYGRPDQSRVELRISVQLIAAEQAQQPVPCIIFSNWAFGKIKTRSLGMQDADGWQTWNLGKTGAVGGLYFIANWLKQTSSGQLLVRVGRHTADDDEFHLGLWLEGFRSSVMNVEGHRP